MRFITKTEEQIIFVLNENNYDGQTVGDLKERLGGIPYVGLRPDEQHIQYDGVVLTNDMLLTDILGDKRHVFVLTKLNPDDDGEEEEELLGAVGGAPRKPSRSRPGNEDLGMRMGMSRGMGMSSGMGMSRGMGMSLGRPVVMSMDMGLSSAAGHSFSTPTKTTTTTTHTTLTTTTATSGLMIPSVVPEIDYSDFEEDDDDDEGIMGGDVFDEDMELPSDLQCYFPTAMRVDEDIVNMIVAMGYDVVDVRQALAASYNNADRAIEYLIDGIPNNMPVPYNRTSMTPSHTPPPSFTGSAVSGVSDVKTPPDPSSPALSSISSGSNISHHRMRKRVDGEGYDANDEGDVEMEMPPERRRKLKNRFKRRIAKAASWAASTSAIVGSGASTIDGDGDGDGDQDDDSKIFASVSAPTMDRSPPMSTSKPEDMKMEIDEEGAAGQSMANAGGGEAN